MLNHVFRYEPVAAELARAGVSDLLEAGSGSRGIAPHLLEPCPITACDVAFDDYGTGDHGRPGAVARVEASVTALPFEDGAFDAAIGLDLLEHIAPADRPVAISELARVASRLVVIGCPCDAPARAVDRRLEACFHAVARPVPQWLIEHLDTPFPDSIELQRLAARVGTVRVVPNESLASHWTVSLLEGLPIVWRASVWGSEILRRGLRSPSRSRLARAIVRALRGWDRGPCYRTIVIIEKPAA